MYLCRTVSASEVNDFYWFMDTSRSHFPEKPRVRMIIPAARLMLPDDAIEIADLVCFCVNQTMFLPAHCEG